MKKLLLLLSFFVALNSVAQTPPINSTNGSPKSTVLTKGTSAADSGYWYRTDFLDTISLNLGILKNVPGLSVRVGDNVYLRNSTATKWNLISGAGSIDSTLMASVKRLKDTAAAIRGDFPAGGGNVVDGGSFSTSNNYLTITQSVGSDIGIRIPPSYLINPNLADSIVKVINDSTVRIKAISVTAGNVIEATATRNDSLNNYNVILRQTFLDSIRNGNFGGGTVDTFNVSTRAWRDKLKDTVNAIKADKATTLTINGTGYDLSANRSWTISASIDTFTISTRAFRDKLRDSLVALLAGKVSGTGTDLQVALWNGTNTITGHQRYTYTNSNDYPSLLIGTGAGATYGASVQLRDVAGTYSAMTSDGGPLSFYGSSTYKSLNFYDYAGGAGLMMRLYSSGGIKYLGFTGNASFGSLDALSLTKGNVDIDRIIPYSLTGNNYHSFTDGTDFRIGNAAFNSFGTFVKFGNNRTDQDHHAAFQTVWAKDSTNRMATVYGFVNAVSTMAAGAITNLYGYYHYSPTVTGGVIENQYGIYIPAMTGANKNRAAVFNDSITIADGSQAAGKLLVSDASGNTTWAYDTATIASFGAGAGLSTDTAAFQTTSIYGSFYNDGSDTLIITKVMGVLQGSSPSITPTIYFNDSLNVTAGATKLVNSPSALTNTTTGTAITSFDNYKIPPGVWVWVSTGTVGTKPTYFSLSLIGYKKRVI